MKPTSAVGRATGRRAFVATTTGNIYSTINGINYTLLNGSSGAANSIAASPNHMVTVGDVGAIYTSTNAAAWSAATSGTTVELTSVTYNAAQGYFLAVGAGANVFLSSDGLTWTAHAHGSGGGATYRGVVSRLGSSIYIAVGNGGAIMTSALGSGTTWTAQTSGTSNALFGIAQREGGDIVAVGQNGTILTSTDSVTWTTRTSGTTNQLRAAIVHSAGLIVVGSAGTILTASTVSGTWTAQTSGTSETLWSINQFDGLFVALGENGTVLTSPTGVTWTARTSLSGIIKAFSASNFL